MKSWSDPGNDPAYGANPLTSPDGLFTASERSGYYGSSAPAAG